SSCGPRSAARLTVRLSVVKHISHDMGYFSIDFHIVKCTNRRDPVLVGQLSAMVGNRQAFPTDEFRGRVRRVQEAMAGCGIDVLLVHAPENIYYLTGYQTSGYFAYQTALLTAEGEPRLLLRFLERGNVDEYSWLETAATWKEGDDLVAKTV